MVMVQTTLEGARLELDKLEAKAASLEKRLLALQTAAYGILAILRRMTGDENVAAAIAKIQQLIATINMLRVSIMALEAVSGPIGLTLAGISLVGALITTADMMAEAQGY
jgi:uncharacterized protein YigA (DUF484 family)